VISVWCVEAAAGDRHHRETAATAAGEADPVMGLTVRRPARLSVPNDVDTVGRNDTFDRRGIVAA
jgi:hypothetical protein